MFHAESLPPTTNTIPYTDPSKTLVKKITVQLH